MSNVVYFSLDEDQEGAGNTLLYFITHTNREKARENWEGFGKDPQWQSAYSASIEDGKLVNNLTSVYLKPVDFSPLK